MSEEYWIDDSPRKADIDALMRETAGSHIDEVNLRAEMISMWKTGGSVNLRVRELPGRTRLVFLGTADQWAEIPWGLWSRIFQATDTPIDRVLFFAHPLKRAFPTGEIEAKHINAGYSYICKQEVVVIYRFEEATRVLVHELLHAGCFDSEMEVEDLEANTEAWAEVILCALLSGGRVRTFRRLWKAQIAWIEAQTEYLLQNGVVDRTDYAWRYTLGRHRVLIDKGFIVDGDSRGEVIKYVLSPRFTTPEWGV